MQVFITVDSNEESRDIEVEVDDPTAFIEQLELAILKIKLDLEDDDDGTNF